MSNRKLRLWSIAVPVSVGAALALLAACGDDDSGVTPGPDATTDQQSTDGGTDARTDAPTDSGGGDADAALAPLCTTYSNLTLVDGGGGPDAGEARYKVIARDAIASAFNRCELKHTFDLEDYDSDFITYFDLPPDGIGCLQRQLEALTECKNAGGLPIVYETSTDPNTGYFCTDAGQPNIWLGFRLNDPDYGRTYVKKDAELLIDLIRARAIASGGYSPSDADRLAALLRAQIGTKISTADAGPDGGHSESTCP
jgi:hypothetical protein